MKYKFALIALMIVGACSKPTNDVELKKKELEAAKNEMISLKEKIGNLEKELALLDSSFGQNNNAVLITTWMLEAKPFEHYIDVRGAVESNKNVSLSSLTGGKIERILVTEGQQVKQGQTLVILEADVLRKSIDELKTSLELATTVYEKQDKLWKQKIGTEIQYLQAKNNKESLESKLATLNAQLEQTIIKAPFTGAIDKVDALVGEMASPGLPLVRMVSSTDMYVKADVSEDFIGRFKAGDKVEVFFPAFNQKVTSTILSVGQVINEENRTFRIEAKLNPGIAAKPNQVVVLSLRDYINPQVFQVPTRIIQRDNEGQFLFAIDTKDGKMIARKVYIKSGMSYNTKTEILAGLNGTEKIVYEGFRDVTEGAELQISTLIKNDVASK